MKKFKRLGVGGIELKLGNPIALEELRGALSGKTPEHLANFALMPNVEAGVLCKGDRCVSAMVLYSVENKSGAHEQVACKLGFLGGGKAPKWVLNAVKTNRAGSFQIANLVEQAAKDAFQRRVEAKLPYIVSRADENRALVLEEINRA